MTKELSLFGVSIITWCEPDDSSIRFICQWLSPLKWLNLPNSGKISDFHLTVKNTSD